MAILPRGLGLRCRPLHPSTKDPEVVPGLDPGTSFSNFQSAVSSEALYLSPGDVDTLAFVANGQLELVHTVL
eukprot:921116-Pleurochrysis_carterae.AAC.1